MHKINVRVLREYRRLIELNQSIVITSLAIVKSDLLLSAQNDSHLR